jgi:hypothetical protein
MKTKKKYSYIWRGLRIVNGAEYERFKDLCRENFSNPSREFNLFIHKSVVSGVIGGRDE